MRNPTLLLLALLVTPGCFLSNSSRHRELSTDGLAALQPGATTAREAVGLLGAPVEVVQLGRRTAYRYDYAKEKQAALFLILLGLRGVDSTEDRAWLFFDEADVLTHFGTTFEAEEVEYVLPLFD